MTIPREERVPPGGATFAITRRVRSGTARVGIPWFFLRAWAVGYFMVRTRQLKPDLPGSAMVRAAGLGWPLVVGVKLLRDLAQVGSKAPRPCDPAGRHCV